MFTNWYGQASCTAGRASFITGRIPIRSALSIVVAPGDENALRKETPTIAEFFQKNSYSTYFSGKCHLGDKPASYPIEHGFDEMKAFAAYYPGVTCGCPTWKSGSFARSAVTVAPMSGHCLAGGDGHGRLTKLQKAETRRVELAGFRILAAG